MLQELSMVEQRYLAVREVLDGASGARPGVCRPRNKCCLVTGR
jgi:hypothetical protein